MPASPDASESALQFHTFLSHNSRNKPAVRELKRRLVSANLRVWYDEDELRPGIPWQELLEAGIKSSQSVVVAVGADGFGPWEDEEMQGALRLAVKDKRPVIPVLLAGCPEAPELPMFLGNRTWVDLRSGITEEGFGKLLWGITGKKPKKSGDSETGFIARVREDNAGRGDTGNQGRRMPETRHASLLEILPGAWQVRIQLPFPPGVMGQLNIEVFPNGFFRGQLMTPMGATMVEGQWQANPMTNQIGLQGMQSNGFQTIPYVVFVQANSISPQQILGVTNAGEQVTWQRASPPPVPPVYGGPL